MKMYLKTSVDVVFLIIGYTEGCSSPNDINTGELILQNKSKSW